MSHIVLAGATGYLGQHLCQQLQQDKHRVTVLARNASKAKRRQIDCNDLKTTNFASAQELHSQIPTCDVVISSIGITKQKDGLLYHDVDFAINFRLLEFAKKAQAKTFVYIAVLNGDHMDNRLCKAKEAFVKALKSSGMDYRIIRSSGFFSDLQELSAQHNSPFMPIFGDGSLKLNPIHGKDLARFCSQSLNCENKELAIGGPQIFTQKELMKLLINYQQKPKRLVYFPDAIHRSLLFICRLFPETITGAEEFLLEALGRDMSAPAFGEIKLKDFLDHCHNKHPKKPAPALPRN